MGELELGDNWNEKKRGKGEPAARDRQGITEGTGGVLTISFPHGKSPCMAIEMLHMLDPLFVRCMHHSGEVGRCGRCEGGWARVRGGDDC